ncbi:MAG: AMP-binding protein [Actinomycetota bacterium]
MVLNREETYALVAGLASQHRAQPQAIAVDDTRESFTFDDVTAVAGGVATRLAELPDRHPVVVFVERSVWSAAGCVAPLWAGRGVVPLDASEPRSRLERIVGRLGDCHLLDTTGRVTGTVGGRDVLDIHATTPTHIDPLPADLDRMATMFFTSASTGEPKGVIRTGHEAIVWWNGWNHPRELAGWQHMGHFAPLNFIAGFIFSVILPACGRQTTILDLQQHTPVGVADIIDRTGIDRLTITPSLAHSLAAALGGKRRLEGVHQVVTFGEGLDWQEVALIRSFTAPDVDVRVVYGSSEGLVITIDHTIPATQPIGTGLVPLGKVIDPSNVRFDPVDGSDTLVEFVMLRDITRSYWGDADLSEQRFGIDDDGVPFWRSGDLMAVDDNGYVHYRGRSDDMVKVNGRLVEPAEAERVLNGIPGIRHAVLIPRTLPSGRSQFVAHLEVDPSVTPDLVLDTLHRELPSHLLPAVLVRHDAMPINDRGKVDRMRLRQAPVTPWRPPQDTVPMNAMVRGIAGLAAGVLDIADLGPDDDLWDIGCDSLGAIEIVEAIRNAHGGDLEANDLIEHSTARAIAARLERSDLGERPPTMVMNAEGRRRLLTLVAGGGAPALQYRGLAWAFGPNQPVVVYEQLGLHQTSVGDTSVTEQAARCVADLRGRQPHGPYVVMGHSYGGLVAHEMARLLEVSGEAVSLVLIDTPGRGSKVPLTGPTRRSRSRLYRAIVMRIRRPPSGTRPGSIEHYGVMFHRSAVVGARHRPGVVHSPILLLTTHEHAGLMGWGDQPDVTRQVVDGDHNSMVQPPNASQIVLAVSELFESATRP